MESKVNYTLVGIFVVVFTMAIIAVAFWLSASYPYRNYQYYLVYMNESVSGLSIQSPVKLNGVEVGVVEVIDLNPDNLEQVRLLLKVGDAAPITTSTVASLNLQGITGVTYIGLRSLKTQAPVLKTLPGEQYPVIPYEPSLLVTLDNAVQDITADIKAVGSSFKRIFDEENAKEIKLTLANVQKFTGVLAKNGQKFGKLIDNFSAASAQLAPLLKETETSISAIKSMADKVGRAGDQAAATMDSGRVMVQNISNQAVPAAIDVLNQLKVITANLESVSITLRRDPAVVVRGKAPPEPGPGE